MREKFRPKGLLTREELQDYHFELRQAYHEIVDALLHPKISLMQNTNGDPIGLTTLTYAPGVPAAVAVERLTPLATLRGAYLRRSLRRHRRASLREPDMD
jgi:hypothetical protein